MNKYFLIILFSMVVRPCVSQISQLETRLFELPDVIFKEIPAPPGFTASYELKIRQPVDHNNPDQGFFYQRAFLSHRGFDKPVVFVTEGYEQSSVLYNELTVLLNANQLEVEHRYFGTSVPDPENYTYLTTSQEAADLHHINQLFKKIYSSRWISTGISKGGQNSIYYRYYYPGDVDVTVPYVAPLNLSTADDRIYNFFDTVNTAECRNKIKEFQIRMLKQRESLIPMLKWYCKGQNLDFTYLTFEQAFEYTILEYSFSFWQWGHDCSEIPAPNSTLEEALTHLLYVSNIDFFADKTMTSFESHYYQAANEVGYYSYDTDDFKSLIKALPSDPYPSAIFTPGKMEVQYNNKLSKDVFQWTQNQGNNFIYIYGCGDAWSATSVPPSSKTNSLWFFIPGASHGTARINNLNPQEKVVLVNTLEKWLQMDIK